MQTYSNASNARRAARVLADKHDNLQSEPSVQAEDGKEWYPAVSVTIGIAAAGVDKVAKIVPHVAEAKAETSPREKVEALLAKTVANGCTRGEMISAQSTARALCEKNGLDVRTFRWPDVPEDKPADAPPPADPAPAAKPARKPRAAKPKATTKPLSLIHI